jgi:rhodanese-related sulfurtransferase
MAEVTHMLKKTVSIVVLVAGSLVNACCETSVIPCGDLNRNIAGQGAKMIVVDVRGAGDFERGHIPGAINAPYDSIEKANLPREGILVLYCGNNQCPWSKLGARTLENAGYKNVMVLDGGISNWTAEGFALETAAGLEKKNAPIVVAAIAPAKMLKLLGDEAIGIIDTRPEKEFKIAHLPGAKSLPFENLGSALPGLSKDIEWVVYDKQSENAKAAVRLMMEKGFKAEELSGGIQVWSARKYPLETGPVK